MKLQHGITATSQDRQVIIGPLHMKRTYSFKGVVLLAVLQVFAFIFLVWISPKNRLLSKLQSRACARASARPFPINFFVEPF